MRWASSSAAARRFAVGVALAVLCACGWPSDDQSGEWYTDWDRSGGCNSPIERSNTWTNAFDEVVDPCTREGKFVWITYAALWCGSSVRQAPRVAEAVRRSDGDVRFITTLTGGAEVSTPATVDDARGWADRFGLARAWTVTEGHSTRTIPQHALIGPDGRTWFRYVGSMSADEILELIEKFRSGRRQPRTF
jgi:hypothetical protein